MDIIETALRIALDAYQGQKDKAGLPYILHPLRIMAKMDTLDAMAVALLHDVLEDSSYTATDLKEAGLPAHIVHAVECLTREPDEDYHAFIERVLPNPVARAVKIGDIEDNINVLRLEHVSARDLERVAKYHKAWKRLKEYGQPGAGSNPASTNS
jgi:hypothetical protein